MNLSLLTKNIILFVFLVIFQILILNNIQVSNLGLTPYMYVLFIVLLPFETPLWLTLIIAFFLGIVIDIFEDSPGVHSSATIFMAFVRPIALNVLLPRDGYEPGTLPRIHFMGVSWFVKYSIILVFFHHLFYFFIDKFSFSEIYITLFEVFITTIFSSIFVILSQYFIFRKS